MEVNGSSAEVASDAINIIVEFAQPNAVGDKENSDSLNGSNDVAVHVFQISSDLLKPDQSQVSAMSNVEVTSNRSQRPSHIDVTEKLKRQQYVGKTLKASKSKSCPPSGTNPLCIYPQLATRELLQFHDDEVVNCQTQTNQRVNSEQEMTKLMPMESSVQESTIEVRPGPITSSTKLALLSFLKKKAAGIAKSVSVEENKNTVEPEVQVTSPDREAGDSSHEGELQSNQAGNEDKDLSVVQPPLEGEIENERATVCDSDSLTTNPVESAQESQVSCKEITSTVVQNEDSIPPSTQLPDIVQLTVETGTPVTQVASMPAVQEVDVVVLPLHLQSDNSKQEVKPKKKKEKKKTDPKEPNQQRFLSQDCVECGKHLSTRKAYLTHMNIHYDRRPFKCVECGKMFRQSSHLEKHKLLHTGEKPYVCQYCNKAFRCRYNHRDHERIHTGEKPCKCNTCGKLFRCTSTLSSHQMSVHGTGSSRSSYKYSGKGVFSCKICKKTFSWSSALSVHKKTHNAVGTYKCTKCPKVFKCNSNLWNHVKTHSKEKPFECELCGQRLKRKGNLKRHLLTQHDLKEAEECLKTSKMFAAPKATKSK